MAEQEREQLSQLIHRLNQTWMAGRSDELGKFLHADVVMEFPGFSGQSVGRSSMIAGFKDFSENATLHEHEVSDLRVSVIGPTAVASYAFDMIYERDQRTYRATGRDLWIFSKSEDQWQAVWRTMLDMKEQEVE